MRLLFLIALLLPMTTSIAGERDDMRLMLKKWGMAYCLGIYQQQGPENEAGTARGGYFQLGSHGEEAYKNVKDYFKRVVPADTKVLQESGKTNNLMRCLDAYESPEYSKLILDQDRWLY
ncbi:hypothetical protein [Pseudomonas protegens]|uniref:hypothetical protein n=1 Tax=Pseudomonas protegens TaxID=380021 RepID=UPI001F161624|nr:hypothetical protein [Pseudomonas protegens]